MESVTNVKVKTSFALTWRWQGVVGGFYGKTFSYTVRYNFIRPNDNVSFWSELGWAFITANSIIFYPQLEFIDGTFFSVLSRLLFVPCWSLMNFVHRVSHDTFMYARVRLVKFCLLLNVFFRVRSFVGQENYPKNNFWNRFILSMDLRCQLWRCMASQALKVCCFIWLSWSLVKLKHCRWNIAMASDSIVFSHTTQLLQCHRRWQKGICYTSEDKYHKTISSRSASFAISIEKGVFLSSSTNERKNERTNEQMLGYCCLITLALAASDMKNIFHCFLYLWNKIWRFPWGLLVSVFFFFWDIGFFSLSFSHCFAKRKLFLMCLKYEMIFSVTVCFLSLSLVLFFCISFFIVIVRMNTRVQRRMNLAT